MIRQLRYYDEGGYTDEEFSAELEGRGYGQQGYFTSDKMYYNRNLQAKLADD